MSEEDRKAIDEILEIVDNLLKDIDKRKGITRSNAYTVRIEDNYAITLRDEFNKLKGEYNALINVKNEIISKIRSKYYE